MKSRLYTLTLSFFRFPRGHTARFQAGPRLAVLSGSFQRNAPLHVPLEHPEEAVVGAGHDGAARDKQTRLSRQARGLPTPAPHTTPHIGLEINEKPQWSGETGSENFLVNFVYNHVHKNKHHRIKKQKSNGSILFITISVFSKKVKAWTRSPVWSRPVVCLPPALCPGPQVGRHALCSTDASETCRHLHSELTTAFKTYFNL